MTTNREEWQTRAARWFCVALLLLGGYWLLRYALGVWLPFLIAWGVAVVVYPLSCKASRRIHLPQKLLAVIFVVLLLALLGTLLFFGVERLLSEIDALLLRLSQKDNALSSSVDAIVAWAGNLLSRFSFLESVGDGSLGEAASAWVEQIVAGLGARLGGTVGDLLAATPNWIFGAVVTLMASFYLSADYARIRDGLLLRLPHGAQRRAETLRRHARRVLSGYGRAYLILFVLTFAEVLVGLLWLRVPYAILLALAVAAVDILPVLGSGTVLLPWAVFALLGGNSATGLGLLILYGVVTLVRQLVEPHLLGGSLGVHPLLSLFCMYVGFGLFGLTGMLLGPAAALFIKEFFLMAEESCKNPSDGV